MDRVWEGAPAAALLITPDGQGLGVRTNAAADCWAARHGITMHDWHALADACWQGAPADPVEIGVRGLPLLCRHVPLGDGRVLLWLDPPDDDARLAAARRATEFLDRALGLAGVSVWRIDLRTQRVHFNAVGFEVVGIHQDPAGLPLAQMRSTIHPDDLAAIERAADEAAAGDRVVDVVARYRNPDGSWRPLLTRRVADRDESGHVIGLAGISLDLSAQFAERERAEALAERTHLVAEAMGVGFWSRDLGTGAAHWDEQMYRIHGRPRDSGPPGFDDWIDQHVHPLDRDWVATLHRSASAAWEPVVNAMFRVPGPEAGERWVQAWTRRAVRNGRRVAFGMHMDVTERERAQARQQRELARTQMAIGAAEVGIWERALDGRIVYWNEAMFRLRGLDPADPRPPDELSVLCSHPDDVVAVRELVQRHMVDGSPYTTEFRVRGADGGWRWLASQGSALRDGDGRHIGMAGINLDITGRKETEALRQARDRAEQASRDKSAFLARVSHELRTPMNAVLGFSRLLHDDAEEPMSARQRARLQRISDAGTQMMALVDDLLDLASLEAGPAPPAAERVEVAEVVLQALDAVAGLAAAQQVRVRADAAPDSGAVRADRRRLTQILTHLLGHAVRQQRRGGEVRVHSLRQGGDAVLCVQHDGPGHSADELAALFEPFQRHGSAELRQQGTGIGLALAARLARALGATLQADGPPGGGTAFTLRLPADVPLPAPAPRDAAAPLSVLCIEDNPVNLLLVCELLAMRGGVQVHTAVDGRSGIAVALAQRPHLVLLDLQLPDIDGLEVLARLRVEPALDGCAIVALSANAMPDHVAAALAAGFDDYWTKPIDFERFVEGVNRFAAAVR